MKGDQTQKKYFFTGNVLVGNILTTTFIKLLRVHNLVILSVISIYTSPSSFTKGKITRKDGKSSHDNSPLNSPLKNAIRSKNGNRNVIGPEIKGVNPKGLKKII